MIEKMENKKDKALGVLKETTGKIMADEELEFQGKMQSMKADIDNRMEDMKDTVLEKANNLIDKVKDKKKD